MDTEHVNLKAGLSEIGCEHSNDSPYVVVQRHVDNAKERNRNRNVNLAFSTLRTLIPTEPRDRKLSKIETLRLATSYIVHLANMIRARTVGDFEGQVCERYGCLFGDEVNFAANQKYICTFCLTDSRRNYQFLSEKNKGGTTVHPLTQHSTSFSQQYQENVGQFLTLHNHFSKETEGKLQQKEKYMVKNET